MTEHDEASADESLADLFRNLAPGHRVGRIWGRFEDARNEDGAVGNAWAGSPEDLAHEVVAHVDRLVTARERPSTGDVRTDRDLIEGLVGDRQRLYRTNAVFKSAVDTLAAMLPLWVDGLAAHAETTDAASAEKMRELMSTSLAMTMPSVIHPEPPEGGAA